MVLMKLPQGENAVVDLRKLLDYCLSAEHPRGRHKARVFAAVGVRDVDAGEMQERLLVAAREGEAAEGEASPYGRRYTIDFAWERQERTIRIRSTWIAGSERDAPRLTSCYVL